MTTSKEGMAIARLDYEKLDKTPIVEYGGPIVGTKSGPSRLAVLISLPEAEVGLEDFLPGPEFHWSFHYDEVHLILEGKAEITYTLPANPSKILKMVAEKGDTYLCPRGMRATWKVVSKEPFRKFCVIMPRYYYEKWQRDLCREEK